MSEVLLKATLVGPFFIVTEQEAVLPFEVVTVTVAVPADFAETFPEVLTAATSALLLLHVRVVRASEGVTVAVS